MHARVASGVQRRTKRFKKCACIRVCKQAEVMPTHMSKRSVNRPRRPRHNVRPSALCMRGPTLSQTRLVGFVGQDSSHHTWDFASHHPLLLLVLRIQRRSALRRRDTTHVYFLD